MITFVFNLEPYTHTCPNSGVLEKDSEKMAIALCKSIRDVGMAYPILGFSASGKLPDEPTLKALKGHGVVFDKTVINAKPYNGYFNKIYAYQYAASRIKTPYVCFIDIDVIFHDRLNIDLLKSLLEKNDIVSALGYEPIEDRTIPNMYLRPFQSEEHEKYVGAAYGITKTNLFPSGVIFLKNDDNLAPLMKDWVTNAERMAGDGYLKRFYNKDLFGPFALTDEDSLSTTLVNKITHIEPFEELIHYHTFPSLEWTYDFIEKHKK